MHQYAMGLYLLDGCPEFKLLVHPLIHAGKVLLGQRFKTDKYCSTAAGAHKRKKLFLLGNVDRGLTHPVYIAPFQGTKQFTGKTFIGDNIIVSKEYRLFFLICGRRIIYFIYFLDNLFNGPAPDALPVKGMHGTEFA